MSQPFEYYRPTTRLEALELLARPGYLAVPLIVQPKPTAPRKMGIDAFVDLSLLGLDYIKEGQDGSVHIGAMATLQELVVNPALKKDGRELLSKAADLVAGPAIRNLSGLWGAIQARSGPPEVILALLTLETQIILLGAEEKLRTISFPEFYAMGKKSLRKEELVLEACLPPLGNGCGWALERVARTPRDEAIVAATAIVEVSKGKASRVTLALAGANSLPEYRRSMAGLVTRRALEKAWEQATALETES
jgi:CO/xanthine dehydrogenase FAD-binding subunit